MNCRRNEKHFVVFPHIQQYHKRTYTQK